MALHCSKKLRGITWLLGGITTEHKDDFYCLNCLDTFEQKPNFNHVKKYMAVLIFAIL